MRYTYHNIGEWEFEIQGLGEVYTLCPETESTPEERDIIWHIEPEIVKAWKNDEEVNPLMIPKILYKEAIEHSKTQTDDLYL
jgi:hypothetical protein